MQATSTPGKQPGADTSPRKNILEFLRTTPVTTTPAPAEHLASPSEVESAKAEDAVVDVKSVEVISAASAVEQAAGAEPAAMPSMPVIAAALAVAVAAAAAAALYGTI